MYKLVNIYIKKYKSYLWTFLPKYSRYLNSLIEKLHSGCLQWRVKDFFKGLFLKWDAIWDLCWLQSG